MPFWYPLGSIFLPEILQNPPKKQKASTFWSIFFASSVYRFWLRFGSQVGAMWSNFFEPKPAKRLQKPLKTRLVAKIRPDPPPGFHADRFSEELWSIFRRFLDVFSMIFYRLLTYLWCTHGCANSPPQRSVIYKRWNDLLLESILEAAFQN